MGENCHLRLILHPPTHHPPSSSVLYSLPASTLGEEFLNLRHCSPHNFPPPTPVAVCFPHFTLLYLPSSLSLGAGGREEGRAGEGGGKTGREVGGWRSSLVNELRVGGCSHNKKKGGAKKKWLEKPDLSTSLCLALPPPPTPSFPLLTISIRLHFLLKANSVVPGLRWMAALELRFNQ